MFLKFTFDANARCRWLPYGVACLTAWAIAAPLCATAQPIQNPAAVDSKFAGDGVFNIAMGGNQIPDHTALQGDGKIVVAGSADGGVFVLRLTPYGDLDTTFGGNGVVNIAVGPSVRDLLVQPDGKLVLVTTVFSSVGAGTAEATAVVRLLPSGQTDPTFGTAGVVRIDRELFNAIAMQSSSRLVLVGGGSGDMRVRRLLPDGLYDLTFGSTGTRLINLGGDDYATSVRVEADDDLVIAGATRDQGIGNFAVARLGPGGALDPTFGTAGSLQIDLGRDDAAMDIELLAGGRIVVGGFSRSGNDADLALVRLLEGGGLDATFNPTATPTASNGNGRLTISYAASDGYRGVARQEDGRLLLAGYEGSQIMTVTRVLADGALDGDFGASGTARFDRGASGLTSGIGIDARAGILLLSRAPGELRVTRLLGGPAPGVSITGPTHLAGTSASSSFVTLRGLSGDDTAVSLVHWQSDRGFAGAATGTSEWSARVPLVAGVNVITVTAVDVSGNSASDTVSITLSEIVYSLSEGATGSFFDLDIAIANPTDTPADVAIAYLRPDGITVPQAFTLGARSRRTVRVDEVSGVQDTAVSAVIRSKNAVPIVVERTMFWDASYYGGHTGSAVDAPRTRWLFGEGNQGFFDTYVLLANANANGTTATVTFLVEGGPNVERTFDIQPTSRLNVYAGTIPELANKSFSIVVTSDLPIIAERAMYFGQRLFEGGHESAGVAEAATSWFHAEGATGAYFDTYILVGNPNPIAANLEVTYLTGDGSSIVKDRVVPANGRLTLFVDGEDPLLAPPPPEMIGQPFGEGRMGYVQAETRRGWGLGGSPEGDRRGLSLVDARWEGPLVRSP